MSLTKEQFFALPSTRKGLSILEKEFRINNILFFNEVSRALRTHLQLPSSVVKVVGKFNFEEFYNKVDNLKKLGYAKGTELPF